MGVDAELSRRRRRGLILGAAGLALQFGTATAFLFAPASFAVFLIGMMGAGVVLMIAAFIILPRRR